MALEIDEMFNRISRHQGVIGAMIFNDQGVSIKSNLDEEKTLIWAGLLRSVVKEAQNFGKSVEDGNNLNMLCIKSKNYQIKIAPEKNHIMVIIHHQVNQN